MSISDVCGDTMAKAIIMAVGDTPLNPLRDLLKLNNISDAVINVESNTQDEVVRLANSNEQSHCILIKGVRDLAQMLPKLSDCADNIVLLYCSPITALGNSLELSDGSIKPEQAVSLWQKSVSQAMELVEENDSYLLCDLNDILGHQSSFLASLFSIEQAVELKPSVYTKKQLANHLASIHLFEDDDAFALYDEALSIGKLFGDFTVHLGPDTDEIKQSALDSGQSVFQQFISHHKEIQAKHSEIENLKVQRDEKVNSLEKQISELQHAKATCEENITQLQDDLHKNKESAEQQNNNLKALEESKQDVELKLQAATAQLQKSQNELTALTSELSTKEVSLKESQEHLTNLQSQLQGKEQTNAQLQSQIEELKTSSAKLNEELRHQQSVYEEKEKECTTAKNALQDTQQELQSATVRITELETQQGELNSTIEQLKEQLTNQHSVNEEKEKECAAAKNALQDTQQQLQSATVRVTELEAQQGELNSTIEQLKEQLTNQQSVNEEKEKECEAAKNALQDTQRQLQSATVRITELEAQEGEFNSTIEQLNEQLQSQQIVIEEQEEALTLKDNSIKDSQEQLHSVNELNNQLKEKVSDLKAQYKETILSKEQECAELSNELTRAQASLQEANGKLAKYNDEKAAAIQELQLANLQIAQLQEELESTFSELQKVSATAVMYEETQSKLTSVTQKLEQFIQEKELSALQISQLQEELELITVQKAELEAASDSSEDVIAEKSLRVDELTQKNEELIAQCASLKHQVEAATQKRSKEEQALVNELQAQLEQQIKQTQLVESKNARLQEQLSQSEAGMSQNNEFQKTELELASLQISQLQEELEYYYSAWQQAQQNGTQVVKMGKHHQKVFNKAQAESLAVTGKYKEDGYQDVHLMLNNVLLGDGRSFAELPVKLVRVDEHVAIEFRDDEQGKLFQHFEDATDEYGPYLRFFANPPESNAEQQAQVYSRMNASERILVMSSIALLAELMQVQDISCNVNLSNEEWRNWRLSAIELVEIIEQQPNWLSFDRVSLKEEYRTDGYEHLWLVFQNVLVGEFWKEHLELKVAATGVNESDTEAFCKNISLEFREGDDGTPPLLTWPAETEDEYGPKYVVSIGSLDEIAKLATIDKNLITHLANNIPSIIDKLEERDTSMSRSKSDWKAASSLMLNNANEAEEVINQEEALSLILEEVISMGSYQHLLFSYKDQETKVKLKAQDINPDTFDAELFIELRNGTPEIIYNDTEFFGEDEFGPRVLIPAESYFGEILSSRISEFEWLVDTYDIVINELESGEGIDELVKRLWLNMLKRKKEII